jgi:hypothetical protein
MTDIPRKKTLQELKSEALAELERRGYDVRGKAPAQIRNMLKAHPPKHWGEQFATSDPDHSPGSK